MRRLCLAIIVLALSSCSSEQEKPSARKPAPAKATKKPGDGHGRPAEQPSKDLADLERGDAERTQKKLAALQAEQERERKRRQAEDQQRKKAEEEEKREAEKTERAVRREIDSLSNSQERQETLKLYKKIRGKNFNIDEMTKLESVFFGRHLNLLMTPWLREHLAKSSRSYAAINGVIGDLGFKGKKQEDDVRVRLRLLNILQLQQVEMAAQALKKVDGVKNYDLLDEPHKSVVKANPDIFFEP